MRDLYVPLPIVWCWCAFLGVGTPRHGRSPLCWDGVWAGPPALHPFRPPCGASLSARCFHGPPGCEVHPDYWGVGAMTGDERPAAPVVRPGPDPDRDARVAARRAADARRAGRALDALLARRFGPDAVRLIEDHYGPDADEDGWGRTDDPHSFRRTGSAGLCWCGKSVLDHSE